MIIIYLNNAVASLAEAFYAIQGGFVFGECLMWLYLLAAWAIFMRFGIPGMIRYAFMMQAYMIASFHYLKIGSAQIPLVPVNMMHNFIRKYFAPSIKSCQKTMEGSLPAAEGNPDIALGIKIDGAFPIGPPFSDRGVPMSLPSPVMFGAPAAFFRNFIASIHGTCDHVVVVP